MTDSAWIGYRLPLPDPEKIPCERCEPWTVLLQAVHNCHNLCWVQWNSGWIEWWFDGDVSNKTDCPPSDWAWLPKRSPPKMLGIYRCVDVYPRFMDMDMDLYPWNMVCMVFDPSLPPWSLWAGLGSWSIRHGRRSVTPRLRAVSETHELRQRWCDMRLKCCSCSSPITILTII